ncbi:tyrosine-type recombinase/integrase [Singulisphaera sp. PoT]|uniref:tyrosine-type recombinase/integrase n=1 Tax=Singulisphaera sp. PoT TaxID=3411797 RepID=UPI003BF5E4E0
MSGEILPYQPGQLAPLTASGQLVVPAIVADLGDHAARRFAEFFAANIPNDNTRAAYIQAIGQFLRWCEAQPLTLHQVEPIAVAAYIKAHTGSDPTKKQHLAAIRMLFDWLVTGQVVPLNPAASVRGPKHIVKKGKTPVLSGEDAAKLLKSIVPDEAEAALIDLRDRALIGVMVYSFARIGAVVGMKVEDYYPNGKRWWLRLHEKGGKFHELPAHHLAEEYLDAYLRASGIGEDRKHPLFQTIPRKTDKLTGRPLPRRNALDMVKRRAIAAGLSPRVCNHTFRATGITAYLENGGTIEKAQQIAAHESPKTTKLYDRTDDQVTLDEIERIVL